MTNVTEDKKKGNVWMINMILFDHKSHKKADQEELKHHQSHMMQERTHSLKKRKQLRSVWLTESITSSWLLIGEACRTVKLPGDRPGASHRPVEPFLNYKLGTHLSVTQRNQCTVECTKMTHMGYNIWKPQRGFSWCAFRENRHFLPNVRHVHEYL